MNKPKTLKAMEFIGKEDKILLRGEAKEWIKYFDSLKAEYCATMETDDENKEMLRVSRIGLNNAIVAWIKEFFDL